MITILNKKSKSKLTEAKISIPLKAISVLKTPFKRGYCCKSGCHCMVLTKNEYIRENNSI
jgi:hypothetical protein